MGLRSRFDAAPLQADLDIQEPRWRKWFQDVWSSINATVLVLPSTVTAGASPYVYQFQQGGRGRLIVSAGTVTLVEWSRNGTVYYPVGTGPGAYFVAQGDYLRITYAVIPTLTQVLD